MAAPDGIDVYFDNAGGDIPDAALGILQHVHTDLVKGSANDLHLIVQSARIQGFTMRGFIDLSPGTFVALAGWRWADQAELP